MAAVTAGLNDLFAGTGAIFTAEQPEGEEHYSTIWIGGDDSSFSAYGSFHGLAEKVDVGNAVLTDNGFVFSGQFLTAFAGTGDLVAQLSQIIAHEAGHLLGYEHSTPPDRLVQSPVLFEVALPEVTVWGGGVSIDNNDTTPSTDDRTDLGTTVVGGSTLISWFLVGNDGDSPLTLGPVTVPEGYTLILGPPSSVPPGERGDLIVRLEPTTAGVWSGDVSFATNDPDENPFNFRITGIVATPAEPEITVLYNGVAIVNNDRTPSAADGTDFGDVVYDGTPIDHTFTVQNQGAATLLLGPVTVPEGFTVTEGLSASLAAGTSDTFIVRMDTGALWVHSGLVQFSTNDPDENPFRFSIEGSVFLDPGPNITVIGNGVVISDGDTSPSTDDDTDFGTIYSGDPPISHTFIVRNDGSAVLQLGPVAVPTGFVLTEGLSTTRLLAGESDLFTIQMDTAMTGPRSGDVYILNNDTGDYPFQFTIMGRVLYPELSPVEEFVGISDVLDLTNHATLLSPIGAGYVVSTSDISALPTDPAGGTSLALEDNDSALVTLSSGRMVILYGQSYSSFYVGSNGYITFTQPDTDYSETLADHFDTPRISVLFDDLNPSASGQVSWRQLSDRVVVTWEAVAEYGTGNPDTMQVEMYFDGRIQLAWLGVTTPDAIVGLSNGLGLPGRFTETDFSAGGL